jgi:hypothetical protein
MVFCNLHDMVAVIGLPFSGTFLHDPTANRSLPYNNILTFILKVWENMQDQVTTNVRKKHIKSKTCIT